MCIRDSMEPSCEMTCAGGAETKGGGFELGCVDHVDAKEEKKSAPSYLARDAPIEIAVLIGEEGGAGQMVAFDENQSDMWESLPDCVRDKLEVPKWWVNMMEVKLRCHNGNSSCFHKKRGCLERTSKGIFFMA